MENCQLVLLLHNQRDNQVKSLAPLGSQCWTEVFDSMLIAELLSAHGPLSYKY